MSIAWLSMANRNAYRSNASEVAVGDYIYGLANVNHFGAIAKITDTKPNCVPVLARLARGGSAAWLLAFILFFAFVLVQVLVCFSFADVPGRLHSSFSPASSANTANDDDRGLMADGTGSGILCTLRSS